MRIACATKTGVGAVRDFTIPGDAGPLAVRHYAPAADEDTRALLVYLHGGGFVIGDLETHDEVCRLLCRHARSCSSTPRPTRSGITPRRSFSTRASSSAARTATPSTTATRAAPASPKTIRA